MQGRQTVITQRYARVAGLTALAVFAQTGHALTVDDENHQEILVSIDRTGRPRCVDTPPPDPLQRLESMPVHEAIAHYVANEHRPSSFTCSTRRYHYTGTRTTERVYVVSIYRGTRQVHAELTYEFDKDARQYRRQGVMTSYWPDGAPQSREYFCANYPVGFHRYFDQQGNLSRVADFTSGDYESGKIGRDVHSFLKGDSRWGNPPHAWANAQLFREVFSVSDGGIIRGAFHVAPLLGSWAPVSLTLTVEDWTRPGRTAAFEDGKTTWQIVNDTVDFQSLAELYQLHAAAVKPSPTWPASQVLACPYLNEAMRPGVDDPRFAFKPVAQERLAALAERARDCASATTSACLLSTALQGMRRHRPEDLPFLARTALLIDGAATAREAMESALAPRPGYRTPNPLFARAYAIHAEAERALGNAGRAEQSLVDALSSATTNTSGYDGRVPGALATAAIALSRSGRTEEATQAYTQIVSSSQPELAVPVREELALAYARRGNMDEARAIFNTPIPLSPAYAQARTGAIAIAHLELLAAQYSRGDLVTAHGSLAEFLPTLPSVVATDATGEALTELMDAMARAGEAQQAVELFRSMSHMSAQVFDVAASLCAGGARAEGLALVAPLRNRLRVSEEELARASGIAFVDARCGRGKDALQLFRRVLNAAGRLVDRSTDEIGVPPSVRARNQAVRRLARAGYFDLIARLDPDDWQDENVWSSVILQLERARANLSAALPAPAPDGSGQDPLHVVAVATARAEILARQESPLAAEGFVLARRLALASGTDQERALNLARIAEVRMDLGDRETARTILDEAAALAWRSLPQRTDRFAGALAALVRGYARLGDDATARRIIAESTDGLAAPTRGSFDRIRGEVALAEFGAGNLPRAAAELRQINSYALRVEYLAKTGAPRDELLELWRDAAANIERAFESAEDVITRRRLVHIFLAQPVEAEPEVLSRLQVQLPFIHQPSLRARASCELAAAYQETNPSLAAELWKSADDAARRNGAEVPPPTGACAAWKRRAGLAAQATEQMANEYARRRRSLQTFNPEAHSYWPLQWAIVQYEYESGEVIPGDRWPTRD